MTSRISCMDNNSLAHTKWYCKYHIVFTPKYRRQIIYKQISADTGQIIRTLCARKGIEIIEAGDQNDYPYITRPAARKRATPREYAFSFLLNNPLCFCGIWSSNLYRKRIGDYLFAKLLFVNNSALPVERYMIAADCTLFDRNMLFSASLAPHFLQCIFQSVQSGRQLLFAFLTKT